ncbi:MAG: hypothetical protein CMJ89_04200 [Planctomycetes bacterium]|nr:hypothetical protein [Planctomycetota bacterium]
MLTLTLAALWLPFDVDPWGAPVTLTPPGMPAGSIRALRGADPTGSGLPGAAFLVDQELRLLFGPTDYSLSVHVADDVSDYAVYGSTQPAVRDVLILAGGDQVQWVEWDDRSGGFVFTNLPGVWGTPVRVAASGSGPGGFGAFAVIDTTNTLYPVLSNVDGPFLYLPPIPLGAPVLDVVMVDLNGDALHETAVQTAAGIRVFDMQGTLVLDVPSSAVEAHLAVLREGSSERLVSVYAGNADDRPFLCALDAGGAESAVRLSSDGMSSITVADVDGDGLDDVVVAQDAGAALFLHTGLPGRTFISPSGNSLQVAGASQLLLHDLDHDGDADLLAAEGVRFRRLENAGSHVDHHARYLGVSTHSLMRDWFARFTIGRAQDAPLADALYVTVWRHASADTVEPDFLGSQYLAVDAVEWPATLEVALPTPPPGGESLVAEIRLVGSDVTYPASVVEFWWFGGKFGWPSAASPVPYVPPFPTSGGVPSVPWW